MIRTEKLSLICFGNILIGFPLKLCLLDRLLYKHYIKKAYIKKSGWIQKSSWISAKDEKTDFFLLNIKNGGKKRFGENLYSMKNENQGLRKGSVWILKETIHSI